MINIETASLTGDAGLGIKQGLAFAQSHRPAHLACVVFWHVYHLFNNTLDLIQYNSSYMYMVLNPHIAPFYLFKYKQNHYLEKTCPAKVTSSFI